MLLTATTYESLGEGASGITTPGGRLEARDEQAAAAEQLCYTDCTVHSN